MFAVIKSGGKQYKVAAGDVIKIEKLAGNVGDKIDFKDVVAVTGDNGILTLGSPLVEGALVSGEILEQGKDEKVIIFKKRRRHNYRRKRGHRQEVTWLRVRAIKFGNSVAEHKAENKKRFTRADAHALRAKVAAEGSKPKAAKKTAVKKESSKKTAAKKPAAKKSTKTSKE